MAGLPLERLGEAFAGAIAGLVEAHTNEVSRLEAEIERLRAYAPDGDAVTTADDAVVTTTDADGFAVDPHYRAVMFKDDDASENNKEGSRTEDEEDLQRESSAPQMRLFRSFTDEDKLKRDLAAEASHRLHVSVSNPDIVRSRSRVFAAKVVNHNSFELFFAFMIATNSIYMGIQIEYDFAKAEEDQPIILYIVRYMYTFVFTLELAMRFLGAGVYDFLCSTECLWNYLDMLLVSLSWIEVVGEVHGAIEGGDTDSRWGSNVSHIRMLRIVRAARLARVLRIGRMFNVIRAFRILVFSIFTTMKTVVWALLLLLIIIYVFALALRQATGDHMRKADRAPLPPDFELYWGTLPRAMFTLFKSISGGLSWHDCVTPLAHVHAFWVAIFMVYTCFTTLAVLNVITGVFCQSAIEGAQNDHDLAVQKHLMQRKEYVGTIQKLFKDIEKTSSCIFSASTFWFF